MAEVPPEAVEFTRMLVRAFYPGEFVVLTDAVLRLNNYVTHQRLAQKLGLQPKELRQMLMRMVDAQLMCKEKRDLIRVNRHENKTRTVPTDFWYVPLHKILDNFLYRVHKMTTDIETKLSNEHQRQKHVCSICGTEYTLLDILSSMREDGEFICERIGVRPDRRPQPCGGLIKEHDNSAQVKHMERMKQRLQHELRELRERAIICSALHIPRHPLENVDEKTWAEIVPEMVGMRGERVDADGVEITDDAENKHPAEAIAAKLPTADKKPDVPDDFVPEKPEWFKDNSNVDRDDEWDYDQEKINIKKGTGATFNADDEKAYLEKYLNDIGGGPAPSGPGDSTQEIQVLATTSNTAASTQDQDTQPDETSDQNGDDVYVFVAGNRVRLSDVTEEMTDNMAADEYKAYFALAQQSITGGGDDEDDEFE